MNLYALFDRFYDDEGQPKRLPIDRKSGLIAVGTISVTLDEERGGLPVSVSVSIYPSESEFKGRIADHYNYGEDAPRGVGPDDFLFLRRFLWKEAEGRQLASVKVPDNFGDSDIFTAWIPHSYADIGQIAEWFEEDKPTKRAVKERLLERQRQIQDVAGCYIASSVALITAAKRDLPIVALGEEWRDVRPLGHPSDALDALYEEDILYEEEARPENIHLTPLDREARLKTPKGEWSWPSLRFFGAVRPDGLLCLGRREGLWRATFYPQGQDQEILMAGYAALDSAGEISLDRFHPNCAPQPPVKLRTNLMYRRLQERTACVWTGDFLRHSVYQFE